MELFLCRNEQRTGPYTEAEVHAMLAANEISRTCLAWREGVSAWLPLEQIVALPAPATAGDVAPGVRGPVAASGSTPPTSSEQEPSAEVPAQSAGRTSAGEVVSSPSGEISTNSDSNRGNSVTSDDPHAALAALVNSGAAADRADGRASLPFQVLSRLRTAGAPISADTARSVSEGVAAIRGNPGLDDAGKSEALRQVVRDHLPSEEHAEESAPAKPAPRGSTQLTLPPEQAKPFQDFARSLPDGDVYKPETTGQKGGYGRELEPHVTALYGLTGEGDSPAAVSQAVAGHGPVKFKLGKLSKFSKPAAAARARRLARWPRARQATLHARRVAAGAPNLRAVPAR